MWTKDASKFQLIFSVHLEDLETRSSTSEEAATNAKKGMAKLEKDNRKLKVRRKILQRSLLEFQLFLCLNFFSPGNASKRGVEKPET